MFVRVVRFTDVDEERIKGLRERVGSQDGPPEGVPAKGVRFLHDADQGTAIVLQFFDSREDMETGARVLAAMDAGETPGTRVSVDACESIMELGQPG